MISSKSTIYRYSKDTLANSNKPSSYIIWIDNYSKFYKKSTINQHTPGYTTYNWTALGCISFDTNIYPLLNLSHTMI